MSPPRIAAWVPDLPPGAAAALPPRRSLVIRRGAAVVAGTATAVLLFWLHPDVTDPHADTMREAVGLLPWLLTLPWLRRLDLGPVPWFFLCLFFYPAAGFLVGRVTYRAVSLPYRDWELATWHVHQSRAVHEAGAVVLVDGDGPRHESPRDLAWRRATSVAWAAVLASFAAVVVAESAGVRGPAADALQFYWAIAVATVAVAHVVGDFVLGRIERPPWGTG